MQASPSLESMFQRSNTAGENRLWTGRQLGGPLSKVLHPRRPPLSGACVWARPASPPRTQAPLPGSRTPASTWAIR